MDASHLCQDLQQRLGFLFTCMEHKGKATGPGGMGPGRETGT